MSSIVDLRSDTVTKPTAAMRKAMAEAEVGDDVYQEDPTVNRLEERAAEIMGKESAIFLPTGCMGNTIGIKLHTEHGDEVLCDVRGHLIDWELSMAAWFSGCVIRTVETTDGILTWEEIRKKIRPRTPHNAKTACIELENTHNMAGGTVYPQEILDEICDRAHELELKVHLDGARIFNAATSTGTSVRRIAEHVDSVMFCLSKALGAPVGSMLAGNQRDIERARLYRKRLGGGMRQAGVLAAAGLIALEEMPKRLAEDHENAQLLASGLQLIGFDLQTPQTNIVIFDLKERMPVGQFFEELTKRGIRATSAGGSRIRFVTHYDVSRTDCERALDAVQEIIQ